jgi:hypothetical protein
MSQSSDHRRTRRLLRQQGAPGLRALRTMREARRGKKGERRLPARLKMAKNRGHEPPKSSSCSAAENRLREGSVPTARLYLLWLRELMATPNLASFCRTTCSGEITILIRLTVCLNCRQ